MVLAKKKAAGAEYALNYQHSLPQGKKRKVIKRKIKPSPVYKTIIGVCLITCFFITALAFTFMKARIACLNWDLNQLKQENILIAEDIEKTKLEIASLKSHSRIKNIATNELGMIETPQITYLMMDNIFVKDQEKEQDTPQLASAEPKSSIFKAFCEVLALQEIIGKG